MKTIVVLVAFLLAEPSLSMAQSRSFLTLKNKFSSTEDVFSFRASGFLSRSILRLAGEREFSRAIRKVKNIRLLTIPTAAFSAQRVSVNGFRNIVRNDGFEQLAVVRENGNEVNVYLQPVKNSKINRYLILIQDEAQVTAVEIKGYIDPERLKKCDRLPADQASL
ncbi:MAG TPA: DUF4252 domain-containing protein [Chryseosolibacter sp.]